MAQKSLTLFIDDIDGSEAEGTVRFGLDGTAYEIDLNTKHDEELRGVIGQYLPYARKLTAHVVRQSPGSGHRPATRVRSRANDVDLTACRTWARENGYSIKDRGRIPAGIIEKYRDRIPAGYVRPAKDDVPTAENSPQTNGSADTATAAAEPAGPIPALPFVAPTAKAAAAKAATVPTAEAATDTTEPAAGKTVKRPARRRPAAGSNGTAKSG